MIQNDTLTLSFTQREERYWRIWKEGKDRGLTDDEIAEKLHRTRNTVSRLKKKAKLIGEYEKWIESQIGWATEENREIHCQIKETNPDLAYVETNKIVLKNITRKIETQAAIELKERIEHVKLDVTEDEDSILNKAASILDKKLRGKKQVSEIH